MGVDLMKDLVFLRYNLKPKQEIMKWVGLMSEAWGDEHSSIAVQAMRTRVVDPLPQDVAFKDLEDGQLDHDIPDCEVGMVDGDEAEEHDLMDDE